MTNITPVDEYYFWKNLIEDKQEASEPVPEKMFGLLALAEIKMTNFLLEKHHLSANSTVSGYLH